jgi:hypothetical protein
MTAYASDVELIEHLRIDDLDDGPRLDAVLDAVSRAIDTHCGQFFYDAGSASARTFTPECAGWVRTHPFHTTTGLVIATGTDGTFDTTWTATTDYELKPDSGYTAAGLAHPYNRIVAVGSRRFHTGYMRPTVSVTARYGWASIPDTVHEATLIKAARIFRRRDTPEGIAGGAEFGAIRISSREDPDVAMLLAPYRDVIGTPAVFG